MQTGDIRDAHSREVRPSLVEHGLRQVEAEQLSVRHQLLGIQIQIEAGAAAKVKNRLTGLSIDKGLRIPRPRE